MPGANTTLAALCRPTRFQLPGLFSFVFRFRLPGPFFSFFVFGCQALSPLVAAICMASICFRNPVAMAPRCTLALSVDRAPQQHLVLSSNALSYTCITVISFTHAYLCTGPLVARGDGHRAQSRWWQANLFRECLLLPRKAGQTNKSESPAARCGPPS